jgi:hypothetical protein
VAKSVLSKYRLGRVALDLRTFTAEELASFTNVPVNTVYGFLHHLGSSVTKEPLPSDSPGRPRTRYSLTSAGVERLIDENLEIVGLLEALGLETRAQSVHAAGPTAPTRAAAPAPGGRAVPARAAAAFAAGAHEAAAVAAQASEAGSERQRLRALELLEQALWPRGAPAAGTEQALGAEIRNPQAWFRALYGRTPYARAYPAAPGAPEAPAPAAAAFAAGAHEAAAVAAAAPAASEAAAPKAGVYAAAAFAAGASAAAAYVASAAPPGEAPTRAATPEDG